MHSKLLAWVVSTGPSELSSGKSIRRLDRLRALRRTIACEIAERGFHPGRNAFTQSYGSARLDASVLLMPRYGSLPSDDERMVTTVDAIQRDLTDHGLLLRTPHRSRANVDGVPGSEGSFWPPPSGSQMHSTASAAPMRQSTSSNASSSCATTSASSAKEYDPTTGRHLGNTPQAFSHAGLITTALTLTVQSG